MTRIIRAFTVALVVAAFANALILALLSQTPDPASPLVFAWRVFLFTALGLPFAVAATIALAVPAYALVRRIAQPTLVVVIAAGVLITAIVTAACASATGNWSWMPLARTIPIGVLAASAWWWIAIRGERVWPEFS